MLCWVGMGPGEQNLQRSVKHEIGREKREEDSRN